MAHTGKRRPLRLGVNIDHVATLRNARGGQYPDPVRAAHAAIAAGADGITAHLREDRRHIRDDDVARLKQDITRPLNLELAATEEMVAIALRLVPNACCVVPENRSELTTEGGLDVLANDNELSSVSGQLRGAGIRVSLFIDPDPRQIEAATRVQADIVELHTGTYCERATENDAEGTARELERLQVAARLADEAGLEVHAGHGLTFNSVGPIAAIPEVVELNIGHFLIAESIFVGLGDAVSHMRGLMLEARNVSAVDRALAS
jgi:pyridoxine 5-phosphate synthase